MATTYAGKPSSFYSTTGGVPQEGAYYSGQRYLNGQLLAPGEYEPGKMTSNETIAQTNPSNVSYISSKVSANQLQAPVSVPMSSNANASFVSGLAQEVELAKANLQSTITQQQSANTAKMSELRSNEQSALGEVKKLTTPFRENLETTQRESLYINQNFEANQSLINELDQLLTEGNNLIQQQQDVTGLAAVRNPRIQKAMDDVAARAGVIQAVISARNGQIAQAENLIDRSIGAITADRNDQLSYYETILNLTNRDIMSLDQDSKRLAQEQISLAKFTLENAQASADYVKKLLVNPASAGLMGEAGVKLTDSVDQINQKLSVAEYNREVRDLSNEISLSGATAVLSPESVPAGQLVSFTDSKGQTHYFKKASKVSSSTDVDSYIKSKYLTPDKEEKTIAPQVEEKPQFTPTGGVGAIWVDPKTGMIWKFTASGWEML